MVFVECGVESGEILLPKESAFRMKADEEVCLGFLGTTASGRTGGLRTLFPFELEFLKWKDVVQKFDCKGAFVK